MSFIARDGDNFSFFILSLNMFSPNLKNLILPNLRTSVSNDKFTDEDVDIKLRHS